MRARTSVRGRDQFSVEKAYIDSTLTPSFSHASRTRLMARTPARWPKLAGRFWRRAQRPLPSMMIPMCRGIWESKVSKAYRVGLKVEDRTPPSPPWPSPAGEGTDSDLHKLG